MNTYDLRLNDQDIELVIHSLNFDTQGSWGDGRQERIDAVIRKIRTQQKKGCAQCGDTNDLLANFTGSVCGKCARANHRKATGKGR